MRHVLMAIAVLIMGWLSNAQAQSLTVDPETIVPLPDSFDMEVPAPDVPPEMARFQGIRGGQWTTFSRHARVLASDQVDGSVMRDVRNACQVRSSPPQKFS
jgi:hypothetical protein